MVNNIITGRKEGNVAFISFSSEPIKDDQLETVHFEFADLCEWILSGEDIRVCVITGITTQTFKWVVESRHGLKRWAECVENAPSLAGTASTFDIPLIVGMEGEIAGPALELALFCDVRLATPASRFQFPHAKMGWMPFCGATQMLPRLIGRGRAIELLLTGSFMDAETAHENGLIHHIVNSDELHKTMSEMAIRMAVNSPISLRFTKETVIKGLDMTIEQGLRLEADLYFLMQSTEDRNEGISAFKEKRKPMFKGR